MLRDTAYQTNSDLKLSSFTELQIAKNLELS